MLEFLSRLEKKIDKLFKLDKKKKIKLRKMLPGIISAVALVAMVLVTVYHSTDGFTTLVDIENASIVHEKESMSFTAYMLREDSVLSTPYPNGSALYLANDAQLLRPGDELARAYKEPINKAVEEKIRFLDECIDILERSVGDGSFTLGDSKNIQDSIQNIYYRITKAIASGNSSVVSENYNEFLVLLNRIESYSGNGERLKALLSEYKTQRNEMHSAYKGDFSVLKADKSGYFFKKTDGYEDIFTSANIQNLTYDSFVEMTNQKPSEASSVGKILLNYKWYLAIPTVKGISDTYSIGGEYVVSFPDSDNRSLKMKLENVIYDETGAKSVLLFSCGIVDASFDYLRIQRVNIVSRDISGYRIPESAVCELNGTTGVYVLKDGMASFRKIVILYQGDGYYIVSSQSTNSNGYYVYIELNDSIIIDCKNMYEGKVIE